MGHREFLGMPFSLEAEPRNRHNGNSSQSLHSSLPLFIYLAVLGISLGYARQMFCH